MGSSEGIVRTTGMAENKQRRQSDNLAIEPILFVPGDGQAGW